MFDKKSVAYTRIYKEDKTAEDPTTKLRWTYRIEVFYSEFHFGGPPVLIQESWWNHADEGDSHWLTQPYSSDAAAIRSAIQIFDAYRFPFEEALIK